MARILTLDKAKSVCEEYKKDATPTLAGLTRLLGFNSYTTFLIYLDRDDEISEVLREAYVHCVECHEKNLYSKACTGSIFWLKTLRNKSLGFIFKDGDEQVKEQPKDINLNINIIPDKQ